MDATFIPGLRSQVRVGLTAEDVLNRIKGPQQLEYKASGLCCDNFQGQNAARDNMLPIVSTVVAFLIWFNQLYIKDPK